MLLSTPGLVLHATPYGESSMVVKVFTRLLGQRAYIVKGVRGTRSRMKQNLLQPLSAVDMVVYDNPNIDLNHIKELSPRPPSPLPDAVANALRFFMTEVLYKALREAEPMPDLFDYVENASTALADSTSPRSSFPIVFLLAVTHHLGIEPLDNRTTREPLFDLQEGRYIATATETTLPPTLSTMLHAYLSDEPCPASAPADRRALLDALLAYCQLHLSGFRNFHSHEILHTVLR